jgi:hypothetical protein
MSDIDGELHVAAKLECKTMFEIFRVKTKTQQQR